MESALEMVNALSCDQIILDLLPELLEFVRDLRRVRRDGAEALLHVVHELAAIHQVQVLEDQDAALLWQVVLLALSDAPLVDAAVLLEYLQLSVLLEELVPVLHRVVLWKELDRFLLEGAHLRIQEVIYLLVFIVVERVPHFEIVCIVWNVLQEELNVEVRSRDLIEHFLVWRVSGVSVVRSI